MTQLRNAWICLDCDEIFDVKIIKKNTCPRCGSAALQRLSKWIPAMPAIKKHVTRLDMRMGPENINPERKELFDGRSA